MTFAARTILTALAACAALAPTLGSAQTVPAGTPPAPGRPTANLVLDAMLATARAASLNPGQAQSASLNASAAIRRYNAGDLNGARSAAIQALIEANRLPPTQVQLVAPYVPPTAYQSQPFPIAGGNVAALDAGAFVAQARGAVAACASRNSANTDAAMRRLAEAQRDDKAGRYNDVRAEARAVVDLCAAAQQQINLQAPPPR